MRWKASRPRPGIDGHEPQESRRARAKEDRSKHHEVENPVVNDKVSVVSAPVGPRFARSPQGRRRRIATSDTWAFHARAHEKSAMDRVVRDRRARSSAVIPSPGRSS